MSRDVAERGTEERLRTQSGGQVLFQLEPAVIGGDSHVHGLFPGLSLSVAMTRRR